MAFNLADLFERVADAVGEREAIVSAGVRQTYRDLDRRAAGLAAAMGAAGLGPGHSVALALGNRVECVEVVLAAFKAGAVPVNLNRQFVLEELRAVLDDARPSLVVADPERAELVGLAAGPSCQVWSPGAAHEARATGPAQPRRERSGDDEYIIYTSGT
ncbi:MAG: AMP-binding protein, partial [Acidimicrobiia bacterium]|nr:AMP-binding protein [Acidimicrobiia bacterium]